MSAMAMPLWADITLPAIFQDGMVLQKSATTPIWGKATPGEMISVTLGNLVEETKADAAGNWRVALDLASIGQGPFVLKVKGDNVVQASDVLVGQVWFCSGQSNMEFTLSRALNAAVEIAGSENPRLRQFTVGKEASLMPSSDGSGKWKSASPSTSGGFSAVAYYFGKKLQSELNEPIGLIHSSWGGTPVESWTSYDALQTEADLKAAANKIIEDFRRFPEQQRKYIEAMRAWSKKEGREDRETANLAEYMGENVPEEGWQPVKLPGKLSAAGLPDAGAVWVRRKVNLPATMADRDLPMTVEDLVQFETIYWNGRRIGGATLDRYKGQGSGGTYGVPRYYRIPGSLVKAGENTVAIRLFSPMGDLKIGSGRFLVESTQRILLDGEWMAKPEFTLPPLEGAAKAEAPSPLASAPRDGRVPSTLFNGMIHPWMPYGIKGILWYQGESNVGRAREYQRAFPLLIKDWRSRWGLGDLPFYFCQLASHLPKKNQPTESRIAELREAQSMTLALPNTGQAVLVDVGEANDIHPRNKQAAGDRLAAIALARDYGKAIPFSGPVYKSASIEGNKIRLHFDLVDSGPRALVAKALPAEYWVTTVPLVTQPTVRNSPQSPLEGFAICGKDQQWAWADARIEGDSVVVESPSVPAPVAVRYAWADNPTGNLYNAAGFPASPFRTDSDANPQPSQ